MAAHYRQLELAKLFSPMILYEVPSAALDQALAELVKTKQQEAWLKENLEAIEKYNSHVEEHGVFSDGIRSF